MSSFFPTNTSSERTSKEKMSLYAARQLVEQSPAIRRYARYWPATVLLEQIDRWFFVVQAIPPNFNLEDEDGNLWSQIQNELEAYKEKLEQQREWLGVKLQLQTIQDYAQGNIDLDEFFVCLQDLPKHVEQKKEELVNAWKAKKETELDQAFNMYLLVQSGLLIARGNVIIEPMIHRPLDWFQLQLREKQQGKKKEEWDEEDVDIFEAEEFKKPIKP